MPEKERYPFYLYVDEFQNIATRTFENLLAESRKFGIAVTVANQNLSQIEPSLKAALFGNVASLITFQISSDDAMILQNELAPIFAFNDIINLGAREIYVKMTIDGKRYDPFSSEVLPVTTPKHAVFPDKIIEQSRQNYAVPRAQVQKELEDADKAIFQQASKISSDKVIVWDFDSKEQVVYNAFIWLHCK